MNATHAPGFTKALSHLRLKYKLPLVIIGITTICGCIIGLHSLNMLAESNRQNVSTLMTSKLKAEETALTNFMQDTVGDLHTMSDSPLTMQALQRFATAYASMPIDPKGILQQLYIQQNAYPIGEKDKLITAGDDSLYSMAHAEYHAYFKEFTDENGYYDMFLVDNNGNVVYTVRKELDFATNLIQGEWKDSGLAKVYNKILLQKNAEDVSLADYTPYAPSNNDPAAFMGRPVEDANGNRIGAMIFQLPINKISHIFSEDASLGKTGKLFLVGEDKLLRNQVRFAEEPVILKEKYDTPMVDKAFAGEQGVSFDTVNHEGNAVITAYNKYSFADVNYAIAFEMDEAEVMAPVLTLRHEFILLSLGTLIVITLMSLLLSRSITRPVSQIIQAMQSIAKGDNIVVPYRNRSDEIGDIAKTLEIVRHNVVDNARLNLALKSSSANIMIADEHLNLIYMNDAIVRFFKDSEGNIRKTFPDFDTDKLIGKNIDIFHKNPSHQRAMLDKLSTTFKTSIVIGGQNFNLIANPIFGNDGERLGTILEWVDGMAVSIVEAVDRSQAMIEFEMDGTIVKANRNFLDMTGYSLEEIQGKHHRMFCSKEYANSPEYKAFWEALGRGEYSNQDFKRLNRHGEEVWLNASYNPIRDLNGKLIKVVKIATDITATKTTILENNQGIEECIDVLGRVSEGDLTHKMEGDYKGAFKDIKQALNNTINKLIEIVEKVKESAESVNVASHEISSGSLDLSARTEQQASALEETAASMEQLTTTVRQNSQNANKANKLALDASQVAENGSSAVHNTVVAMKSIEKSSQKISDIIGVIDEIAFQTNLLALNAAVEAARAGEAGKGFAVVASEVRSLAGRSASASKEIKALIEESGAQVRNGVELADKAGETLKEILSSVTNVTGLITEIAAASNQQAAGINEVSSAISQMDQTTQQNAALVEENTASAGSLSQQAAELHQLMQFFHLDGSREGASSKLQQVVRQAAKRTHIKQVKPADNSMMPVKPNMSGKKGNGHYGTPHMPVDISASGNTAYDMGWEEF